MIDRPIFRPASLSTHILFALCLGACATDSAEPEAPAAPSGDTKEKHDFPAPESGYTRIVAPVLKALPAGADLTVCQYVQAPLDHDVDVLDVGGHQSLGGHHAVAYASTNSAAEFGTSTPCGDVDNITQGAFLGGIGGEAGGGVKLPPGVAFRLRKGSSIMLNTHFINPTDREIDGYSVVDFKFAEVSEERTIAAMFVNGSGTFQLAPHADTDTTATCAMTSEMKFILFTNHMHEHGASAITEILRKDGSVELAHEDPSWTYEMQFKAVYSKWPLDEPLRVMPGDTIRTRCTWRNDTDQEVGFPREMCFGVGFFLSDGKSAPVCLDGSISQR